MPNRERFETVNAYFQTLFHELTHATGHVSRLNRPTLTETGRFGSNPYCKEELVAEMGVAFSAVMRTSAKPILKTPLPTFTAGSSS